MEISCTWEKRLESCSQYGLLKAIEDAEILIVDAYLKKLDKKAEEARVRDMLTKSDISEER